MNNAGDSASLAESPCGLPKGVRDRLIAARAAAKKLRAAPTDAKRAVLLGAATQLVVRSAEIVAANARDLAALPASATSAFRDRLLLDGPRISHMAESLRQVAALPDPVGEVVEFRRLGNGLETRRVRAPLGVILMIFESRPNVACEAFSLAFMAGNAILLRGGKESMGSTGVIYDILGQALTAQGFAPETVWGITDPDRALTLALLRQKHAIDVVVPRGGDSLISFVVEHSKIPIIKNDRGLCHIYVHEDADLGRAVDIVENAKTQRPGVCNSLETLLVHEEVAARLLAPLFKRLSAHQVRWFVDPRAQQALAAGGVGVLEASQPDPGRRASTSHADSPIQAATDASWDTEYLDYILNCKVVSGVDEAIAHIERHGSRHSESILTASESLARRFQSEVDAAAVYWNASTRFTDGFELGLGGELGISTQKLHVRGPVGLRELTSVRWLIDGQGQIRE